MKNGKDLVQAIACAGVGYALGNINPAYLISTYHGYDVRQMGSGNAGGTNIMMLEGKLAGISVMAFDIGKATLSVKLCQRRSPASNRRARRREPPAYWGICSRRRWDFGAARVLPVSAAP